MPTKPWPGSVRIVLDTNVIVSGFISPSGPPAKLLAAWLDGDFWLVTSDFQLDELGRVLMYDRLRERVSSGQAEDFLRNIPARSDVIGDKLPDIDLSSDPDDNRILATAVAGNADLIVSGDKNDMISLGRVGGIVIVTAGEALNRLSTPSGR